jgi:Leucine-rich repeat (LRR) protein
MRLQLGNNLLVDVPDCVASLLELAELYVNNNQLYSLSPAVTGRLTSLTHLALSNNELTHLPHEIGLLRSLVVLDVRRSTLVCSRRSLPHTSHSHHTLHPYRSSTTS